MVYNKKRRQSLHVNVVGVFGSEKTTQKMNRRIYQMGVERVYREERTSKAGRKYQVLCIEFENGYTLEQFLSNEQQYILADVELIKES